MSARGVSRHGGSVGCFRVVLPPGVDLEAAHKVVLRQQATAFGMTRLYDLPLKIVEVDRLRN